MIQTIITCPTCNSEGPKGLLFCLFCGVKFDDADSHAKGSETGPCPLCCSHDELSKQYCTACGAQLDQSQTKLHIPALVKRTGFNWSAGEQNVKARSNTSGPLLTGEHMGPASSPSALLRACVPGVILGLLTTLIVVVAVRPSLNYLLARCFCPRHGLAVAIQLPKSVKYQDVLVRLENSDGVAVLQNGHPDSEGLLTVRDIRPGNYRMTIKAPGCATGFTAVTIKPDHPTLVGFPSPVRLPLETETASTGANTN